MNRTAVAPEKFEPVIVMSALTAPLVGLRPLTTGAGTTVKSAPVANVPAGFDTLRGPVVAPTGTVARSTLSLSAVNEAIVPLNRTALAVAKPLPRIVTWSPGPPLEGLNELMVGGRTTRKLLELATVPATFVKLLGPEVAPAGTVARIWVLLSMMNTEVVPLNLTALAVEKLVPVSVIWAPLGPFPGLKAVTVGAGITVKLAPLVPVPAGFVTLIVPDVVPTGTTARS